jgi:superfamily II DNA or RNA helicase
VEEGYDGKPITSRMINNVANYIPRTSVIIREVQKIMEEPTRKMLILSDRRDHLKYIHTQLTEKGFDVGFYVGGMKQKDLDISETKPIILGTFSMSSEALDIPELNTLFMTTPKTNIEQSVGRILRKTHEIRPLIIDIKDNFRPFANQCTKRKTFYKKCKYEIYDMHVKTDDFEDTLEKNKNIHNMTSNIIDDLNETTKKKCKKKSEQSHIEEFMMLSDDD